MFSRRNPRLWSPVENDAPSNPARIPANTSLKPSESSEYLTSLLALLQTVTGCT